MCNTNFVFAKCQWSSLHSRTLSFCTWHFRTSSVLIQSAARSAIQLPWMLIVSLVTVGWGKWHAGFTWLCSLTLLLCAFFFCFVFFWEKSRSFPSWFDGLFTALIAVATGTFCLLYGGIGFVLTQFLQKNRQVHKTTLHAHIEIQTCTWAHTPLG